MVRNGGSALALVALLAFSAPSAAQEYPSKPITLMVPYAAGGPTDIVARSLGQTMGNSLGQTIVIENAVGAGGTIAPTKLKSAAPDGYTLLLAHIGMSTAPALYRTLAFRPIEDFEHIGQVVDVPMTLIARQTMEARDLRELVAYIKANKDKLSFANAGVGSASHLCGLLFMSAIDIELTTVPYKGTAPAMNDLLGAQVDLLCDQTTQTTQYIKSGRVKRRRDVGNPRRYAEGPPDARRGGPARFRSRRLARYLRAEGHTESRAGQACRGVAGRDTGPGVRPADERSRQPGGESGQGHPRGTARAPQVGDRPLDADHQEGGRLRD
jgi:tripartite-type tricarboxylate transporter receptor subunit TctC